MRSCDGQIQEKGFLAVFLFADIAYAVTNDIRKAILWIKVSSCYSPMHQFKSFLRFDYMIRKGSHFVIFYIDVWGNIQ